MVSSSQITLVGPSTTQRSSATGVPSPSRREIIEVVIEEPPPVPRPQPKKRKRINAVEPPEGMTLDEPPYRNTRARSRSVAPEQPEPAPKKSKVDKGKQRAVEPEPESEPEPELEPEFEQPAFEAEDAGVQSVPGETYQDEQDVAELLEEQSPDVDPFAADSDEEPPHRRGSAASGAGISPDDARTNRRLFGQYIYLCFGIIADQQDFR